MKRFTALALLCIAAVPAAGCGDDDPVCACPDSRDISFTDVEDYRFFSIQGPSMMVIREEVDWLNLWVESWTGEEGGHKTAPPHVDFDSEMVIAVTWGARSGCTNVSESIGFLLLDSDTLYVVSTGLEDLGPCDALVFPIHMVKTARRDGEVVFIGDLPVE